MEYAILDFCLWINGFDGLGKSRQVVGTGNQNIIYPTMLDANGNIYCFLDDLSLVVNVDKIKLAYTE